MTTPLVAFLRPSAAHTWIVCNGYVKMRSFYPEEPEEADTEIREDGTACHWLAAEVHAGRFHELGSTSPNGRTLDDSMFDAVDEYLDVLRSWQGVEVYVERSIDCSEIYPGMSGTPDAWAYNATTNTLYIADLKYGFRFVEVWFNWQLLCYIASLIALLRLDDRTLTVVATIVQPRSNHRDGPVRTWRVRASDLRPYINDLKHAANAAMLNDPICTPNPHCNDCPARHACVALQNSALIALEQSYAGVPLELDAVAAGDELRRLKAAGKRLDARVTGLESQVEGMLRNGVTVPQWGLETTFARTRYRDGMEQAVINLGQYFNVNLAALPKPINVGAFKKLVPANVYAAFTHKPSTGVRLTQSDPLQATKKFTTT